MANLPSLSQVREMGTMELSVLASRLGMKGELRYDRETILDAVAGLLQEQCDEGDECPSCHAKWTPMRKAVRPETRGRELTHSDDCELVDYYEGDGSN